MRQFYFLVEKGHAVRDQLSWTHYRELLKLKDKNEIDYYVQTVLNLSLSYRKLRERIKSNEYERLDDNTKLKLINNNKTAKVSDFIKNPILVKNKYSTNNISEKMLQQLILEDIPFFLKELGIGFTFIENEYPIKIGDKYNYIDLLLFNIKDNRYVVVELKVTELKKEHIGQIEFYMNYIDEQIKDINHNPTLGIIICKKGNKFIMKYVTNKNIYEREYELIKK